MGASTTTLRERLEAALGARVIALASIPVGFGLAGYTVDLADGRKLAVKLREGSQRADLSLEAYMLGELARHSDLPVPAVHVTEPDLLVMDFIQTDGGGITPVVERHAAELIAALHVTPRPAFGYERDTLIGPLPQPNPKMDRWIPFFRGHRLLAMARAAAAEEKLPVKLLTRLERLGERLPEYLTEPPAPSLLHGDLWTGNVLVRGDRIAGFVDPFIAATRRSNSPSPRCSGRSGRPSSMPMRRSCRWSLGFTNSARRSTGSTRRSCTCGCSARPFFRRSSRR